MFQPQRFLIALFCLLSTGFSAQAQPWGCQDAMTKFAPLSSGFFPVAYGSSTTSHYANNALQYFTVATVEDASTNNLHPVVAVMDVGFNPSYMVRLDLTNADIVAGTAIERAPNGELFVGITFYNSGTATNFKYLVKTDATGLPIWTRFLGNGVIHSLLFDDQQNALLVFGEENEYLFTSRINPVNGSQVWGYVYGTQSNNFIKFQAGEILIDPTDENYVIVGTQQKKGGDSDIIALKLDLSGFPIWGYHYGRPNRTETGRSAVILTNNQTITIAGEYNDRNVLLLNLNGNGSVNWVNHHSAIDQDFDVQDVTFNPVSNRHFVAGKVTPAGGRSEGFIMPLSNAGGNLGSFLSYSTIYYAGSFGYEGDYWFTDIDTEPGGEMTLTGSAFHNNTSGGAYAGGQWMLRTDLLGNCTSACQNTVAYASNPYQLVPKGKPFLDLGPFVGNANLTHTTLFHNQANNCQYNFRLAQETTVEEAVEEVAAIYPNPSSDLVTVSGLDAARPNLWLVDLAGRRIEVPQTAIGADQVQLDVQDVVPGVYFITTNDAGQGVLGKLIVQ